MTPALRHLLQEYRVGLDTQLALLDALLGLAAAQHDATRADDLLRLGVASAERQEVVATLLDLERELYPWREELARHAQDTRGDDEFAEVSLLHRRAEQRIADVLAFDRETRAQLDRLDRTRRQVAQELEAGEATLAAYRKVLSPACPRSAIVDQRG